MTNQFLVANTVTFHTVFTIDTTGTFSHIVKIYCIFINSNGKSCSDLPACQNKMQTRPNLAMWDTSQFEKITLCT